MENNKNKKGSKSKQSEYCENFGSVLRSSGMLIPESDEEVQVFKTIYGETEDELPEKFKTIDFMFNKHKKDMPVIPLNLITQPNNTQLSYAARDGQEHLPEHIMNKMKEMKNKKPSSENK